MAQMIIDSRHAVEGDVEVSKGFFFSRIGVPILVMPPIRRHDGLRPDEPELLPSQGLAVCEQLKLLFVAHSSGGFLIANIDSVMRAMKESTETQPATMAQPISDPVWRLVDVGRVRLLSLSPESSILAACVGGTVNFFSIEALVQMEERPFRSRMIDGGSSVKDMRWLDEMSYILLASCGKLYRGRNNEPLILLMENVDAVDCSPEFAKIAVVRNDELSIFSLDFNEVSHITLSLHPWMPNSDDSRVKVDSLKWNYTNRIVLGCSQLTPDGMEESYCLLVTSPTGRGILRSFHDVFPRIPEDIMPAGSGPHLFFSCLKDSYWGLAIAAHRENLDQHIVLFSSDHWGEQMARVDIDQDDYLPRIELQENGDDNLLLGLCTEVTNKLTWKPYMDQSFGDYPRCILWCLSLEGKLTAFFIYGPFDVQIFVDIDIRTDV